jgi:TonB family protein
VQNQTFNNPQGGMNDPGSSIQFDTKGIDFGPWIRRFVAQVRRNWFIPNAAMSFRGHVVIQFNIHRNGRITDVNVVAPSSIESFNRAAYNAILGSNPVEPLPPEYPDPVVLFTVTFFYNEQPPG